MDRYFLITGNTSDGLHAEKVIALSGCHYFHCQKIIFLKWTNFMIEWQSCETYGQVYVFAVYAVLPFSGKILNKQTKMHYS